LTKSDDRTPLHVSAVLHVSAGLKNTNKFGNTPLMLVAYHGKLELVCYLTQMGADINFRNKKYSTLLHLAANSVDIIKLLLHKGMTVNLTNSIEYTPLHVSAAFGNLEATKAFVERGSALNNTDIDGNTPLMVAEEHGKSEVVHYLKGKGARSQQGVCPSIRQFLGIFR
jgi:ankyrin repeat protein